MFLLIFFIWYGVSLWIPADFDDLPVAAVQVLGPQI